MDAWQGLGRGPWTDGAGAGSAVRPICCAPRWEGLLGKVAVCPSEGAVRCNDREWHQGTWDRDGGTPSRERGLFVLCVCVCEESVWFEASPLAVIQQSALAHHVTLKSCCLTGGFADCASDAAVFWFAGRFISDVGLLCIVPRVLIAEKMTSLKCYRSGFRKNNSFSCDWIYRRENRGDQGWC